MSTELCSGRLIPDWQVLDEDADHITLKWGVVNRLCSCSGKFVGRDDEDVRKVRDLFPFDQVWPMRAQEKRSRLVREILH